MIAMAGSAAVAGALRRMAFCTALPGERVEAVDVVMRQIMLVVHLCTDTRVDLVTGSAIG